jgi:hypothetical protein
VKTLVLRPPGVQAVAESRVLTFDFSREPEFLAIPPDSIGSVVAVDVVLDVASQAVDPDLPPTAGTPVVLPSGSQVSVEFTAGSADGNSYYVTCQVQLTNNPASRPQRKCILFISSTADR